MSLPATDRLTLADQIQMAVTAQIEKLRPALDEVGNIRAFQVSVKLDRKNKRIGVVLCNMETEYRP